VRVRTRALAALFLKAGNLTFGGGDAITAVLQRELVVRLRWITLDQFALAQSLGGATPGTRILAFAAAVGWLVRGWRGTLTAVLAISVPSAALTVLLTAGFESLRGSRAAALTLAAVLASAVGLMWAASWLLLAPQLAPRAWLKPVVVFTGAVAAFAVWSISPIQVIAASAVLGALWVSAEPS
jgi:chromate transporter